jgi:hypothetical protein
MVYSFMSTRSIGIGSKRFSSGANREGTQVCASSSKMEGFPVQTRQIRQVPSGGVTLKRRCTYRPSVIYLIVNKLLSLSLSLSVQTRQIRHVLSGNDATM